MEDYLRGMSALQLAEREGCSVNTLLRRLREAGVALRPAGARHTVKELGLTAQTIPRFLEIVDGLLLGDGHINEGGALQLGQKATRVEWLQLVASLCTDVGMETGITPAWTRKPSKIKGRKIQSSPAKTFYAHTYRETKNQRQRWYPEGSKEVPHDVVVTPLSVALWYCGDGTGAKNGTMTFCTHDFTEEEVCALADELSSQFKVGATTGRTQDGPVVAVYRRDDALKIKQAIAPYVPSCFAYKLQHIRAATPRGRALRRLTPLQVRRIREAHADGVTAAELGRQYGVSNVSIINAVTRRTYRDVE